jgi:pyruvyltransferase
LRQTYNLFYYLINKKDVIVITGWIQSIGNKVIPRNFGDDINYDLVKFLSKKQKVINICNNILFERCLNVTNYACIGSIAGTIINKQTIVWGSGCIDGNVSIIPQKICAVRGMYTRDSFINKGVYCPEVYGDPALLLPMYYPCNVSKKYKYGLIPHYIDLNLQNIKDCQEKYKSLVKVIDLKNYADWREIVHQINQCEVILSSSLHGLIVSDAYNIPNVWIMLSNNISGGYFKYLDYFSAVNRHQKEPVNLINKDIIPENIIMEYPYEPIVFDKEKLLKSCPFIHK